MLPLRLNQPRSIHPHVQRTACRLIRPTLLPSLAEQTEIVRCVESLFALADRLEARVSTARAKVATLTPATLAKAFLGQLVPQDPNDEPASVLLERIRAEREASAPPKTRRRAASLTHSN